MSREVSFGPFDGADLVLYLESGGQKTISLSAAQLSAVVQALGLSMYEGEVAGYDDWTLADQQASQETRLEI